MFSSRGDMVITIKVSFDTRKANDIIRKMKYYRVNVERNLAANLGMIGSSIVATASAIAPVGVTGALRDSLGFSIEGTVLKITSGVKYAAAQEFGFMPHTIPLEWIVNPPSAGEFVTGSPFVTVMKNTPFVRPAIELTRPEISKLIARIAHESWE